MITLDDVCCGAGLAHDGYTAVGVRVRRGVDLFPQPNYPGAFLQFDATDYLTSDEPEAADAIHASWPCQILTDGRHLRKAQGGTSRFGDLLTPGIALLRERWAHKAWIVENVDDRTGIARQIMAPGPGEHLVVLCGSMFGLPIWRHRLFLANFPLRRPEPVGPGKYRGQGCRHDLMPLDPRSGRPRPWGIYHVAGDSVPEGGRTCRDAEHARECMGSHRRLPWEQIKEGFPPAYTSYVGADLIRHLS